MNGKLLGVDFGRRRIGLALSDETGTIASPAGYIINKGSAKNLAALRELQNKHRFCGVVCGIPLHIDGSESEMSREVRVFAGLLRTGLGVEVVFVDERYSSKEAEEHIRMNLGIKNHQKVAELVDTMAATMLLQGYLDSAKKTSKNG